MSANKKIFCNTPWYEIHIYWDGSYGICCQESHKLYPAVESQYNIANMSIADWVNSAPVTDLRTRMLGNTQLSECSRCYFDEDHSGNSRRLKSNQKSVIFTRTAFESSFQQSPGFDAFEYSRLTQGKTITHPIDIHIDLGNYCNLACKMCNSKASSKIAAQEVKWGIESSREYVGTNWTSNQKVWENFKQQLLEIPRLTNIHLMGGETLLTGRFEDLVDTMIENKRFELCFSFVSNGTVFNPVLIEKLKKFRRVGIEVSIETLDQRNSYIRQGTDTALVLSNIEKYLDICDSSSVTIALRPAPSLLSVGGYNNLLNFALDRKLVVKSNLCHNPKFLNINMLPTDIKNMYLSNYQALVDSIPLGVEGTDYNASDPTNYSAIVKEQALMCIDVLSATTPTDNEDQLRQLVEHCKKWDAVYNLNARELYPELSEIWDKYGY
jgi:organic radical activating enzyme